MVREPQKTCYNRANDDRKDARPENKPAFKVRDDYRGLVRHR